MPRLNVPAILGADGEPYPGRSLQMHTQRRWESAETNRLNKTHWARARDQPINLDLRDRLATLRTRSIYEAANNPIIEGMIETHATDLIGPHGPSLQVIVEDDSKADIWASQLESAWDIWWSRPDINGILGGADMLQQWVRMLWLCGEFLAVKSNDKSAAGAIQLRLQSIHPRDLTASADRASDPFTVMGIKRSKTGKPLNYFINNAPPDMPADPQSVPAKRVIHGFRMNEPGQVRGVPWLSSVLQTIADLHDFDDEVLDSARQANYWSVALTTQNENAEPLDPGTSANIERRQMTTLPPGYQVTPLIPPQPAENYVDYRDERMGDLGRPVAMPRMIVRLDSRKHNYSSARFDAQAYTRHNRVVQAWLERIVLNSLAWSIAREAEMSGQSGDHHVAAITAKRPARVKLQWTWPTAPHVDPVKEANAEKIRLANRTLTLTDALAAHGKTLSSHIKQLQREQAELKAAGLTPVAESATTASNRDDPGADMSRAITHLFRKAVEEYALENGREEWEGE